MNLTQRIDKPELMDTVQLSPRELKQVLFYIELSNQYFGGIQIVLNTLNKWKRHWKKGDEITILDIGTGSGDIPLAISNWGIRNNLNLQITGIDIVPEIVEFAKRKVIHAKNISIQNKNLYEFPNQNKKFDYVISSLFFHHIPPNDSRHVLTVFDAIATRGLLISDLIRTTSGYWFVKITSQLIGNRITRNDGPLSIQRALTVPEFNDLISQSGLTYLKAKRESWLRLTAEGEKNE